MLGQPHEQCRNVIGLLNSDSPDNLFLYRSATVRLEQQPFPFKTGFRTAFPDAYLQENAPFRLDLVRLIRFGNQRLEKFRNRRNTWKT